MIGVVLCKKDVPAESIHATFWSSGFKQETKIGSWGSLQFYQKKAQFGANTLKTKDVCNCVLSCLNNMKIQKMFKKPT